MSKIRASARGEDCQVRIEGVCNFNPETTIFAHLGGGGMGAKRPDFLGVYCCSSCHDVVDHRVETDIPGWQIELDFFNGMIRTQIILHEKDLIILK